MKRTNPLYTAFFFGSALSLFACGSGAELTNEDHSAVDHHRGTDPTHNIQTVFLIMMENKNWGDLAGNSSAGFINSLLPLGGHAEGYHNAPDVHPSEPNYIWLVSGDNFGIDGFFTGDNDPPHQPGGSGNHVRATDHLASQLDAANIPWRSYQEDISGTQCPLQGEDPASGPQNGHGYRPKHNPFVFFYNLTGNFDPNDPGCIAHNRPLA